MEGAGEGVVAILQGTKHAGLRVTLVPDNRLRSKRKCVPKDAGVRPPIRIKHSSVETNTERVFKNASEPMCDVRYASSYQFANCKAVQSSFYVSDMRKHSAFCRPSDQFAASLRKYPVQASSEILQRIINYSNIKPNIGKQNLKSIRSILHKSTSQQMNRRYANGVNTNNNNHEKKPLKKSISTIGNRYSSQKEMLNYTYDYLKCMSLVPRSTDVRYLTQVKRCIRNRLLEIVDDRPVICTRIRSRYDHHKRHFHGSATNTTLTPNENEFQDFCTELNGCAKYTQVSCKNSSCSKGRLNFFHQPKRCDFTSTFNKHSLLESLTKKLCPKINCNKKKIFSKEIVQEPKTQVPGDGVDDEITSAVSEWLKSIPVYPNFSENDKIKQKELAFKLAENLRLLKNPADFISKAKKEIMLCVNDLPMWYPPYLNDKEQFIDQIVADLLKRLDIVLENELRYKVAQAISNLPYTEYVDTDKIVDDFAYKIKTIVLHPPEDEKKYMATLKSKILDLLNKLPIQCTIQKLHDVADKLVNQLLVFKFSKSLDEELMTAGENTENTLRENILKWCKSVPELKDIDFSQNKDLIDDLEEKFKHYESRRRNFETLQEELVKVIRIWLEDAANSADLRLNSKIKNRLSNKIANQCFSTEPNQIEALQPLLKWYYGIQELSDGERAETRKDIDRLSKELNEIQSRDNNFEIMPSDMKEVVTVCLKNMLKKRGKHLDSKVLDNSVNKLISELKVIPKRKEQRLSGEYGQFYRDIISWIKNIPYLKPESHLNETKVIEQFVNKLNNICKGSDIESTITEAVRKFIKLLSEDLQVRIHDEDIQILKDKLFKRLQHTFKDRKHWDIINYICQSILSEFSNILQESSIILDDTKLNNINNKFYKKFLENIEQDGLPNWTYLLRQLNNIFMQETKLGKYKCEDLAKNIITRLQRMFPKEITSKSTILSQPVPVPAYVEPTRIMEHNLDATKKYRTQKDSNDSASTHAKNKSKKRHNRKINLQAGDGRKYRNHSRMSTNYRSSNSDLDMHDSVSYYDNNYEISKDRDHQSALNKNKEYQTSTPLSAAINNFSTALDEESSIGNVTVDTQKALLDESKLSNQTQFFLELKNVIRDWIKSIQPNTNNFDLDDVVDDIASDIIDRQKYLQLSQTKYSENDELEHLKYQIYRKLNKLKRNDFLPQILSKINSLYRIIKTIRVPDLIKPVNESHIPATSGSYNSIFYKIRNWLDSVSSNLLKSSNIKQNPDVINELVQKIINDKNNNKYDYEIEKDILLWLQNVLRNVNDKIFHKLADDLKSNLKDIALKTSHELKDNSELIDDNIFEAITAWLQSTPFHKICTLEVRDLQKQMALLLATNLRNILQATKSEVDSLNDQLIEEVQKYLKTIPIPAEFRNNIYYYKAACELVEYLKQTVPKIKEMCDGINTMSVTFAETSKENDYIHFNDLLQNIIHNWCDSLPIHFGHTSESKEQAQKLKQNIEMGLLEKLYNVNQKEPTNDIDFEILLSDEINKILKNVPMNRELENSLPVLKCILIGKLKQAKYQTQSLVPKKILHDTLSKTLQELGNTPDLERTSLNLLKEKLADAFINLHYQSSTDYEFRNKLKDELCNEINKFCNAYLERYPSSPIDIDEIQLNLYAILKKVPIPDMQNPYVSDVSSKLIEKEVNSKNATTQYSSQQYLPSTLSNEDREHLEIIRRRADSYPEMANFEHSDKNRSPHEVKQLKDVGVQTDYTETVGENVQTSKTLLLETISSGKEILPQVVIKEFYWDSPGSKQNLSMFVPPALTPYKMIPGKNTTNDSQNQTETNLNNNLNTQSNVNISRKIPEARKVRKNKVDKASDATSQENHEKQEQVTNTYRNSPAQELHENKTIIIQKDSNQRKQQTEKPFHQYHRKRDTYPDRVFDNGVRGRCWIEQPRIFEDDDRYIPNDVQSSYLEDFDKTPGDRRIPTQRKCLITGIRNKEDLCWDHNLSSNCRNGESACRRRCTLKYCSKCCGGFCPHPTMAFFK